jgi:hypothetical protein
MTLAREAFVLTSGAPDSGFKLAPEDERETGARSRPVLYRPIGHETEAPSKDDFAAR